MANNYGNLYIHGRAKSPSSPWSDEELAYVTESGKIDMTRVDELRNRTLLDEAHQVIDELEKPLAPSMETDEVKTLNQLTKEEALLKAQELGLTVDETMHRSTILAAIRGFKSEPKLPDSEEAVME